MISWISLHEGVVCYKILHSLLSISKISKADSAKFTKIGSLGGRYGKGIVSENIIVILNCENFEGANT